MVQTSWQDIVGHDPEPGRAEPAGQECIRTTPGCCFMLPVSCIEVVVGPVGVMDGEVLRSRTDIINEGILLSDGAAAAVFLLLYGNGWSRCQHANMTASGTRVRSNEVLIGAFKFICSKMPSNQARLEDMKRTRLYDGNVDVKKARWLVSVLRSCSSQERLGFYRSILFCVAREGRYDTK